MSDYPEFFQTARVKARKRHRCCECGTFIEPGSLYQRSTGKWHGELSSFSQCLACHVLMDWMRYQVSNNPLDVCFTELHEWVWESSPPDAVLPPGPRDITLRRMEAFHKRLSLSQQRLKSPTTTRS